MHAYMLLSSMGILCVIDCSHHFCTCYSCKYLSDAHRSEIFSCEATDDCWVIGGARTPSSIQASILDPAQEKERRRPKRNHLKMMHVIKRRPFFSSFLSFSRADEMLSNLSDLEGFGRAWEGRGRLWMDNLRARACVRAGA